MKTFSVIQSFVLALCLLASFSCTDTPSKPADVLDNPVDPKSPVFTYPVTTILTPYKDGDTITLSSFLIKLQKEKDVLTFSYKLDNNKWAELDSTVDTIFVDDLDEGKHILHIKAKHIDKKTEEKIPKVIMFYVNAVTGPSLMFYPRSSNVTIDSTFNIYLLAEEVQALYGVKASFSYDVSSLRINSITAGSLAKSGSYTPNMFQMVSPQLARIEMFLSGSNPANGLTGTDTIAVLNCTALKRSSTALTFYSHSDSVQFRTVTNTRITMQPTVNGKVVVK
jgi:hypothetical protein